MVNRIAIVWLHLLGLPRNTTSEVSFPELKDLADTVLAVDNADDHRYDSGPILVEEQVIHLKSSRHPLKALAEQSFVSTESERKD